MNARRRTTMNIGEGSGIPQPSMLRQPRASLAPSMFTQGLSGQSLLQTARKSEAPGLLGAQTPARNARALFGSNNPPMSHARNNAAAGGARFGVQTPGTNRVNRRTSVFASSRRPPTTIGIPGTASRNGGVKDPRPIKDRSFLLNAQNRIMSCLSSRGYSGILTPKTLVTPTVKDFQTIFRFLYTQLDPRYSFTKKFVDEALSVLRGIRYPYVGNITKSHIYAAGSMSTWPGLLAMLLWMVELIEAVSLMTNPKAYASLGAPESEDSESREPAQFVDRVFFDYLSQAYPIWLETGEESAELESMLADQFEQKNASLINETADVEKRLADAKKQLENLISEGSDLEKLEIERALLVSDKGKVESYIQKLESKHKRSFDHVVDLKQKLDAAQVEQMRLESEKVEVKKVVDAQQISTEDVDRMSEERNLLVETLKNVQEKAKDAAKVVWDNDMKMQRLLDEIDTLAQEYTSKAQKLGLIGNRKNVVGMSAMAEASRAAGNSISSGSSNDDGDVVMVKANSMAELPDSAKEDPLGGVNIELVIDTNANDRQNITSVDLGRNVRPALQRACDVFASQLHATQSAALELREKRDQLSESRTEQNELVEEMDKLVKKHNQQYQELRDIIMAETRAAAAQIEQLEADIVAMRRANSQCELESKTALAHAEAEWESVQRGCRLRRGEINENVVTILEDVIQMKTHARARMEELLQLVSESMSDE
ncbi:kinetochore-associated Ndc80 complex subunit ndc80 [Coemansia interrupta]|uniref:Kinetochore protein NDC80 n=1 Tax=Coemansia interrupta TaxID=1126814 RepID=A0A9W8HN24_9FUNG|nr:kinetochore-associated Ndc80 complex subunit ndc80 [Coemansia interrupta]